MKEQRSGHARGWGRIGFLLGVVIVTLVFVFGDSGTWYYDHRVLLALAGIPALTLLGWFIGLAIPVDQPAAPSQPSVSVRNRCTQCGNPRVPGDQFCGNCGAELT